MTRRSPHPVTFTPTDTTRVGGRPAHFLTWWDAYQQAIAANGDRLTGLNWLIVDELIAADGWTKSERRGGWWRHLPDPEETR
jgi:hypothetical protein